MSYYLIRVGESSKYIEEARHNGFVAIDWDNVPDIQQLGTLEKIKKVLSQHNNSPSQIAMQAGQLNRFGLEMQPGDIVISPKGGGEYYVGESGEYYYESAPPGYCKYQHRRKVTWYDRILSKDDMSTNLSYALGAAQTIFSLNKYSLELESLIAGKTFTPAEKPQRIRDLITTNLMEFDGKEFEEFIRHILEIVGFTAETTQYVGDKGIDINGTLDAEGLATITLRVQVKRVSSNINNKQILALRGALSQGEHGCFITLSSFTSQAIEEATAPGKIPIKLIDGNDLAILILKHFEDIDDEYKRLLGIRKRKDFNIEEQFEASGTLSEKEEEKIMNQPGKPKWDTLVCSAREDGFKEAFLEQKAWWAVKLSKKTIPDIKYLAMYQVAPVSQITYYGKVSQIEPFQDTGKYKLYLEGEPIKLEKPVGLGKNTNLKPQGPKYTLLRRLMESRTLDDVFGQSDIHNS